MLNVRENLHDYFKARTDRALVDSDNLFNIGLLDSMAVLELVYHLETSLGIEIDPDDISESNFKTIDTIETLVAGKLR